MKRISKRVFSFIMAMAIVVGMIMAVPMYKGNAATQSNPGQKLVMNTLYKGTLDERGL